MKKILILFMLMLNTVFISSCKDEKDIDTVMIEYIDSLIDSTDSYIPSWNKESYKGRWNYIDGVFLNSIVNLYYEFKDIDINKANYYKEFFIGYINYYIDSNGVFINPSTGEANYRDGELDSVCESKILFDAYEFTNDSRYLEAIDFTLSNLLEMPRCEGTNNFWHKTSYSHQIWLDGMYMYGPFYARYAMVNNDEKIFEELVEQYKYIRNNMFDENKKLYYHGYDSTKMAFWSNDNTGCSSSFWLRSMGWYIVSICDVIDYFDEGEDKQYLISLLKEAVDGILQYQDKQTKMFYQIVDIGNQGVYVKDYYLNNLSNKQYQEGIINNYVESSGSSMIAYAIIKGVNEGYLDEVYKQIGIDIFKGIYNHSFIDNRLNDICITAGLGPDDKIYRDGSHAYYLAEPVGSNDAKGVGPFIMAYLEYRKAGV